jgi:hypothetical protein
MMTPAQTRQVNSTAVIQADDNVLSIDAGKHSQVKDSVIVTTSTSTLTATLTQSNV